ncbi:hypothetical protein D3C86_1299930 [compost metagenome]
MGIHSDLSRGDVTDLNGNVGGRDVDVPMTSAGAGPTDDNVDMPRKHGFAVVGTVGSRNHVDGLLACEDEIALRISGQDILIPDSREGEWGSFAVARCRAPDFSHVRYDPCGRDVEK